MKHENLKKIEVLKTENVEGYKLAETEFNEIIELELHATGIVDAHSLPINVVFYVVKGTGIITIDGELFNAHEGDVIEVKANAQRSWKNENNELLKLLVIKQKL